MNYARARDLITVLTRKELKVRYKSLKLGYLWSLANPLAYGMLYYLIFKFVMKVQIAKFPLFLVSALFAWQWMSNSIGVAWITYLGNAPLIKKVNFPRNLIPLVVSIQDMIHFWASLPIIVLFMILFNVPLSPWMLIGVPVLSLIQLGYSYSLCLLISTLNLFFRDLAQLVSVGMTFLFYLTPIVYSVDMIPPDFQRYAILNPMVPLMMSWRALFLQGEIHWDWVGLATLYATILLAISHAVYRKLVWRFAEVL